MRVVISGATGFIGSNLAKYLAERGVEVHALLRVDAAIDKLPVQDIVRHTITEEPDSLQKILGKAEPDIIYHLAARYETEHKTDDIPGLIADNVTFSAQLFDACARTGFGNIVVMGTSWQQSSATNSSPVNFYAAAKGAQELIGTYFADAFGLRASFLRIGDTYGPNDPRPKLFSLLRAAASSGQELPMSPGEQELELVYVDDVLEALIHAGNLCVAENNGAYKKWSIRATRAYSLKEIVAIWEQTTGLVAPIEWSGRPYRSREVMKAWHEAPPLPGWAARVELREGIALMERVSV